MLQLKTALLYIQVLYYTRFVVHLYHYFYNIIAQLYE